jgi:hypothetical protein
MAEPVIAWDLIQRYGPPPEGIDPTFDDGLPEVVHEVIARGEQALRQLRERTVLSWVAAGAAWKTIQMVAMRRSHSSQPHGRRYAEAYHLLEHPWPQLAKIDGKTRRDAIWLFESEDTVRAWLSTQARNQGDRWTHPIVVRRHFEARHPSLLPNIPPSYKLRPPRHTQTWSRAPLGPRTRQDLEDMIGELGKQLVDRDHEISELLELLEDKDRRIAQLEVDLAWEREERRQFEGIATG